MSESSEGGAGESVHTGGSSEYVAGCQHADFITAVAEATQIKKQYTDERLNWFRKRTFVPRFFFRLVGVLVILVSVTLPFLTTLTGVWRDVVLPIGALVVAGLTGITAFYRWDNVWRGRTQTANALQYYVYSWELAMAAARREPNCQKAIALVYQATRTLLDATHAAIGSESEDFFKDLHMPQSNQGTG